MIKKLMFLVVLFVAALSLSSAVSAVDINSTATSTEIQEIIDNTTTNEIAFSSGATYTDISLTLNKSFTINGNGATLKSTSGSANIITISSADTVRIYNLTFIGIGTGTGIRSSSSSNIILTDLKLTGNGMNGTAIDIRQGNGVKIENVEAKSFFDGIRFAGGKNVVVNNCNISDMVRNNMDMFQGATNITITNNNLNGGSFGIYFGGGLENVLISGNNITNMKGVGIGMIKSILNTTISNNNIKNNEIGIIAKSDDDSHGTPTEIDKIIISGNNIADNWLIGLFLQNLPESIIGTDKLLITDDNNIANNGIGYNAERYNSSIIPGVNWNQEIGGSLNIVKTYSTSIPTPEPTVVEKIVEKIVTVEKEVTKTVTKTVTKNVVIQPTIKASKTKVKKGKKIVVYVKLKNLGKNKSNTLKIYNKYTKKTLKTIINGGKYKTLKFVVKVNKKGTNKIPIYLNGKLIGAVKVKGV